MVRCDELQQAAAEAVAKTKTEAESRLKSEPKRNENNSLWVRCSC